MIAFRRSVAIILAVFFVLLLLPLLVVYRVNSTVANPDFYVAQLRQADIYNFVYDDVLPKAMEESARSTANGNELDLSLMAPIIIPAARDTFPPVWLQTQTENGLRQVVPYVAGSTDSFSINIPLKDTVNAGVQAMKKSVRGPEFTKAYDQMVVAMAATVNENSGDFPIPIDKSAVPAMVRRVMPPDWVAAQLDGAITEMAPYFVQDKEHFTVRIDVNSRIDDVQAVLTDLLKRPETYSYLFDNYLGPRLRQSIPASVSLGSGVSITSDEITAAAKQALPYDWYQQQVTAVTSQTFAYIKGTQDTFKVTFTLADRKAAIVSALSQLADRKLEQQYNALPPATPQQAAAILANPSFTSLPAFRLPGVSYADLKRLTNINIAAIISPLLTPVIPNDISLTGTDLGFTATNNPLASLRDAVKNGITFTDVQLVNAAGSKTLTDIRKTVTSGLTLTEQDLQKIGADGAGDNAGPDIEQFRSAMKTVRGVLAFAWIVPLLLLAGIGFLGGRRWSSRIIWAAAALAAGAFLALVAFGPVYEIVVRPILFHALPSQLGEPIGVVSLSDLLAHKGSDIVLDAVGSFMGGLELVTVLLFVLAIGLIVFGSIWHRRARKE